MNWTIEGLWSPIGSVGIAPSQAREFLGRPRNLGASPDLRSSGAWWEGFGGGNLTCGFVLEMEAPVATSRRGLRFWASACDISALGQPTDGALRAPPGRPVGRGCAAVALARFRGQLDYAA